MVYQKNNFKTIRPLLNTHRFEIRQFVRFWKLPIYSDKSNQKTDYLRNKIRKQLMPTLRILFNPQVDAVLLNFIQIRKDEQLYFQNTLNFLLKPQLCHPLFNFLYENLNSCRSYSFISPLCTYILPKPTPWTYSFILASVSITPLTVAFGDSSRGGDENRSFAKPKVRYDLCKGGLSELCSGFRRHPKGGTKGKRWRCTYVMISVTLSDGDQVVRFPITWYLTTTYLEGDLTFNFQRIFQRGSYLKSIALSLSYPTYVHRHRLPLGWRRKPEQSSLRPLLHTSYLTFGLAKLRCPVEALPSPPINSRPTSYRSRYNGCRLQKKITIHSKEDIYTFSRNQLLHWLIVNNGLVKKIKYYPNVFQRQVLKTIFKTFNQVENASLNFRSQHYEKKLTQLLIIKFTKKLFTRQEKKSLLFILETLINKY